MLGESIPVVDIDKNNNNNCGGINDGEPSKKKIRFDPEVEIIEGDQLKRQTPYEILGSTQLY